MSERCACRAFGFERSVIKYRSIRPTQEPLRARICEIAGIRVSYGYRRVHVLLRREGWPVNTKRIYRLYREEGLSLRQKRPKRRRAVVARQEQPAGRTPNERWTMDFMSDALADGRKLRVLTVLDTCTRECVALRGRCRLPREGCRGGADACGDSPGTSRRNHGGPWDGVHLASARLLGLPQRGEARLHSTREADGQRLHRELQRTRAARVPIEHYFSSIAEARLVVGGWREDYNSARPHSALGQRTPTEFRAEAELIEDRKEPSLRGA